MIHGRQYQYYFSGKPVPLGELRDERSGLILLRVKSITGSGNGALIEYRSVSHPQLLPHYLDCAMRRHRSTPPHLADRSNRPHAAMTSRRHGVQNRSPHRFLIPESPLIPLPGPGLILQVEYPTRRSELAMTPKTGPPHRSPPKRTLNSFAWMRDQERYHLPIRFHLSKSAVSFETVHRDIFMAYL